MLRSKNFRMAAVLISGIEMVEKIKKERRRSGKLVWLLHGPAHGARSNLTQLRIRSRARPGNFWCSRMSRFLKS